MKNTNSRPVKYRGEAYPSIKALARAVGMTDGTLNYRIMVLKMSPDDAVDKPLVRRQQRRKSRHIKEFEAVGWGWLPPNWRMQSIPTGGYISSCDWRYR